MHIKKYMKLGVDEIGALTLILFGTLLRVLLVGLKWPLFNSDEGTMGIMALHIAYRGEHPIFYYGQNYMGTLDAYFGAGPSILTLRFGIILLYVTFMGAMYCLTRMLYTQKISSCHLAGAESWIYSDSQSRSETDCLC
jgi:hypothetical protein